MMAEIKISVEILTRSRQDIQKKVRYKMSTVSKIGDTGEGQNDFTVVTPQLNVNVPEKFLLF